MSLLKQNVPPFAREMDAASKQEGGEIKSVERGPAVRPWHEVYETSDAYGLTVYLPGVVKEGLELSTEEGVLRLHGRRAWRVPEGWSILHREMLDAGFELMLRHDDAVEVEKIHAELRDGVLRVALPKVGAAKTRKIPVN